MYKKQIRIDKVDKQIARINEQIIQETQFMLEEIEGLEIPAFQDENGEIIQDISYLIT